MSSPSSSLNRAKLDISLSATSVQPASPQVQDTLEEYRRWRKNVPLQHEKYLEAEGEIRYGESVVEMIEKWDRRRELEWTKKALEAERAKVETQTRCYCVHEQGVIQTHRSESCA